MDIVLEFFENIWDSVRSAFEILLQWLDIGYTSLAPLGAFVSVFVICIMVRIVRNFS